MKYDIYINNIYWKTIEGNDFEQALKNNDLDYDFRTSWGSDDCGILEMEELPESGVCIEIRDVVNTDGVLEATWGPEE